MAQKVDSSSCDHFFVFGEKKETASALGTHYCHCKYCGINFHKFGVENVENLHLQGRLTGISRKESEKLKHVHAWDPVEGKPNTYRCCSYVTDWKRSRPGWELRVPCGMEIVKTD